MISTVRAISQINQRRLLAESKAAGIKAALRENLEYLVLENKLGALYFEKAGLVSENQPIGSLNDEISALEARLAEIAREMGFDPDDREPKYTCAKCNDRGFILGEMCECAKALLIENLQEACGEIKTNIDSIAEIGTDIYGEAKPRYEATLKQLENYVEKFPSAKYKNLIFSGDTGTGKSYIASVICTAVTKKGFGALFVNAVTLNELFLKRHLAPLEEKEKILQPFFDCDLLVIDDLGAENFYNNVTAVYLYMLLMERTDKNTIITTNLSPEDMLIRYDARIASRLTDTGNFAYILFEGKDLRRSKRK